MRKRVMAWLFPLVAGMLLAFGAATAQAQSLATRAAAAASAPAEAQADPLERGSPRSAIVAFSRAVDNDDYAVAVRYAQLTRGQQKDAEALLHDLNELLARYLTRPLTSISDAPEGTLADGLPPDRERIGPLRIGDEQLAIELVRVDEGGAKVWLITSETLRGVPAFHALLPPTWSERMLPPAIATSSLFGISIVRMLHWAASIVLPLLLLHFLLPLVRTVALRAAPGPARHDTLAAALATLHWPLVLVVTLVVHVLALPSFGSTLPFRIAYARIVLVLLIAALAWAAERIFTLMFRRARTRLADNGRSGARSLLMLGERLLKVLVVVVALLVMLSLFGVDTRTALAGLGIVGFGVALGAKKTVENILGGVMLLGDQAIAIGDECRISGRHGWVEDITLRSVRLRTREQTLLSIPSGVLADASIENFSSRRKFLADDTLRLAYRTTAAQVRQIRDGIDAQLRRQEAIEQASARIHLVGFGTNGIELQLYACFVTANYPAFLAAREALLQEVAAIVESAGGAFATPFPQPATPPEPAPAAP